MTADAQASWRNPRILFTLLLVFLCGALAGALTMRFGFHARVQNPVSYWAEGGKNASLHRFETELNLTPEQSKEMESMLDDFVQYYDTIQAQMDEVRANGKSRILRVLTPEQRKKFEKMLGGLNSKQVH